MASNQNQKIQLNSFNKEVSNFSQQIVEKPELFAGESKEVAERVLRITKTLFDFAKSNETPAMGKMGPFKTLFVDGFDPEQIWEEIQLRNEPLADYAEAKIDYLLEHSDEIADDLSAFEAKSKRPKLDDDVSGDEEFDSADMEGLSGASLEEDGEEGDNDDADLEGDLDDDEEDGEMDEDEMNSGSDQSENEEEDESGEGKVTGAADDMFFSQADLEDFLEQAEMAEAGVGRGDVDSDDEEAAYEYVYGKGADDEAEDDEDKMDEDEGDEEDEEDDNGEDFGAVAKFSDFFAPVRRGSLEDAAMGEGDDNDNDAEDDDVMDLNEWAKAAKEANDKKKSVFDFDADEDDVAQDEVGERGDKISRFEAQQERMRRKIQQLEDEAVAPKSWQLIGEVRGVKRPENSLLEETLEFEHATKTAPAVTEERTSSLEELIKKRIKDGAFDDVVRRKADSSERGDYRSTTATLDSEKSKKSLSEIYEDEYMKQTQGVEQTGDKAKLHMEAAQLFRRICIKLDALSNQNYVPLKVKDVKVRKLGNANAAETGTAAIAMEEVTPVAVSEAVNLAPEEIYRHAKKDIRGDSELTSEDRQKIRRENKERAKKQKAAKEAREREDLLRNPEKKDKMPTMEKALETIKGQRNVTFAEGGGSHHRKGSITNEKYTSTAVFERLQAAQQAGGQNPKKRQRDSNQQQNASSFKL